MEELRAIPASIIEQQKQSLRQEIRHARRTIHDARVRLELLESLTPHMVAVPANGASGSDPNDEDERDALTATEAVEWFVNEFPGRTRDEIFDGVKDRVQTSSNDKRGLITNTLRRLVVNYDRIKLRNDRYYPPDYEEGEEGDEPPFASEHHGGEARSRYNDFEAPPLHAGSYEPFQQDKSEPDWDGFEAPPLGDDDDLPF